MPQDETHCMGVMSGELSSRALEVKLVLLFRVSAVCELRGRNKILARSFCEWHIAAEPFGRFFC